MIEKDEFDYVEEVEPTHRSFPIGYVEELQKELKKYIDENDRLKEWISSRSEYRAQAFRLRNALQELLTTDGEILPVYNDEFFQARWVRNIVRQALDFDK